MPNHINKASLPPNLYRLLSMIFSNLVDYAMLCRASDRLRKKVKFHGIFRDKFAEKSAEFSREFTGQTLRKSIGKKRLILWLLSGKISLEVDRFCAERTRVFNVFLTESIISCFSNNTLQK